ncbi:MAG: hypothetical protein GYA23_04265 [Methanomicrobiales archaeon]|nr:hypothetical protein [Methanomicrobiales archaeon]
MKEQYRIFPVFIGILLFFCACPYVTGSENVIMHNTPGILKDEIISIDTITPHSVNDVFTVSGTTNIFADSELIIEIYPANRSRTIKGLYTSGAAGQVRVIQGIAGKNTWSFFVDTSDFEPDTYRVDVSSYTSGLLNSAQFRVSKKSCDSGNCSTGATSPGHAQTNTATPSASCQSLTPASALSISLACFALYRARICQDLKTGQ